MFTHKVDDPIGLGERRMLTGRAFQLGGLFGMTGGYMERQRL